MVKLTSVLNEDKTCFANEFVFDVHQIALDLNHWTMSQGQKIKTELAAMVRDLPADFDRMAASTQELEGAVKYYDAFVNFLVNR